MDWFRAIVTAFSTFSRLPMPQVQFENGGQRAVLWLPVVGAVVGLAQLGLAWLCAQLGLSGVLFGAVGVALPLWLTGGIHLDGFCDTVDALSSWQGREKRLEILKDPHVGAFGVIHCGVYLLVNFALLHELYGRGLVGGVLFVYPLSRALAALSALHLPKARAGGMLVALTPQASAGGWVPGGLGVLAAAGLVWLTPAGGTAALVLCLPLTVWYCRMARASFGGATGDTTGFYLQLAELCLLAGLLAGGLVWQHFY